MTLLVLASGSPRRRELLAGWGATFDVRPPEVDETPLPGEGAAELVARLAEAKARAAVADAPERPVVVLAADTAVALHGEILGKPVDAADATAMLGRLSGSRHEVLTGVAVALARSGGWGVSGDADGYEPRVWVDVVTTVVTMREMSPTDVETYVASGEPMDKAGSYAIQETGDRFVESIDGPFDNVVGLPMDATVRLLRKAGIVLLPH